MNDVAHRAIDWTGQSLLGDPGIEKRCSGSFKISRVARHEREPMGERRRGDQYVQGRTGTRRHQLRPNWSNPEVDRKNPFGKILNDAIAPKIEGGSGAG